MSLVLPFFRYNINIFLILYYYTIEIIYLQFYTSTLLVFKSFKYTKYSHFVIRVRFYTVASNIFIILI